MTLQVCSDAGATPDLPVLSTALPLCCGVRVRVDPARPTRWADVTVHLVGEPGADAETREVAASLTAVGLAPTGTVPSGRDDDGQVRAWRRLAVVDALDRWLHLPVDAALVGAERAWCRWEVARRLDDGRARAALVREAVGSAYGALDGLVGCLERLAGPVPAPLDAGLRRLADGFAGLAAVEPGVQDLVNLLRGRPDRPTPDVEPSRARTGPVRGRGAPLASRVHLLDPRQVPARVLDLSDDPRRGEVLTRRRTVSGFEVLDVEVGAYPGLGERELDVVQRRLLARFVDQMSGAVCAELALDAEVTADASGKRHVFRTRLPLEDLEPDRLRVDVIDVDIDLPPARTDADALVARSRAQMSALATSRVAAAEARLGGAGVRVEPDQPDEDPRPEDPLVAELALAYELSRA